MRGPKAPREPQAVAALAIEVRVDQGAAPGNIVPALAALLIARARAALAASRGRSAEKMHDPSLKGR
jgi:hypothetical protein